MKLDGYVVVNRVTKFAHIAADFEKLVCGKPFPDDFFVTGDVPEGCRRCRRCF